MNRRRGIAELMLFVTASAIGIFAFGRGLAGFFGMPHSDPLWLPVGFAALWVLAKQMGRIQDRWPRRRQARRQAATSGGAPGARGRSRTARGAPPVTDRASPTHGGPPAATPGRRA
ncbi:MAG TPA: hypothetical protein VIV12_24770 [Streptosporangiaceae bacterium]